MSEITEAAFFLFEHRAPLFHSRASLSEQINVRKGNLVRSTKIAICLPAFNSESRPSMISRKIKLLAAAAGLVALATTVGLASTKHTNPASVRQTQGSDGGAAGLPADKSASPHHGILTCGSGSTTVACEQLEMMLPLSARSWTGPFRPAADI